MDGRDHGELHPHPGRQGGDHLAPVLLGLPLRVGKVRLTCCFPHLVGRGGVCKMFHRTENFLVVVSAPPNVPKRREDTYLRPLPDLYADFCLNFEVKSHRIGDAVGVYTPWWAGSC